MGIFDFLNKSKYKKGDKVTVIDCLYEGAKGEVQDFDPKTKEYSVRLVGMEWDERFVESELKPR